MPVPKVAGGLVWWQVNSVGHYVAVVFAVVVAVVVAVVDAVDGDTGVVHFGGSSDAAVVVVVVDVGIGIGCADVDIVNVAADIVVVGELAIGGHGAVVETTHGRR
jgi:hypothetical protein